MKKESFFLPLSCAAVTAAGYIFSMSGIWSDRAAWSYIISPVIDTPWEIFKPFALAYIFWILIELSCLRPHLLHFVCSKSVGIYFLFSAVFLLYYIFSPWLNFSILSISVPFTAVIIAECVSYALYNSSVPIEILKIPLLLTYLVTVLLIIILTAAAMKNTGAAAFI